MNLFDTLKINEDEEIQEDKKLLDTENDKIENKSEHPVDTVLYGLDSIPYIITKTLTSNIITLDKNTLEILDSKNIEFPNKCKKLSPYDIESIKRLDLTISFKIKESSREYIMCW